MNDLIEALKIFAKYSNEDYPTHCEHDVLYVVGVHAEDMEEDDLQKLDNLGFFWEENEEVFMSFKFGSA